MNWQHIDAIFANANFAVTYQADEDRISTNGHIIAVSDKPVSTVPDPNGRWMPNQELVINTWRGMQEKKTSAAIASDGVSLDANIYCRALNNEYGTVHIKEAFYRAIDEPRIEWRFGGPVTRGEPVFAYKDGKLVAAIAALNVGDGVPVDPVPDDKTVFAEFACEANAWYLQPPTEVEATRKRLSAAELRQQMRDIKRELADVRSQIDALESEEDDLDSEYKALEQRLQELEPKAFAV